MVTSLTVGQSVTATAEAVATHPKWMEWSSAGNLGGQAELPSGYRRMVELSSGNRATEEYVVQAIEPPATDAMWRAIIWASNGSYIFADGFTGIPTIGTPQVRLQENAPSKTVLHIAQRIGATNVLSASFAGWSDGHTEAVSRGMELTVEYRRPDRTIDTVFRGMIYQITDDNEVEITAYDRLMDLYQFSEQYQNGQDGASILVGKDEHQEITDYFTYTTIDPVGLITLCMYWSKVEYLPLNSQSWKESAEFDYREFAHSLPSIPNATFTNGSSITGLYTKLFVYVPSGRTVSISATVTFRIYKRISGVFQIVATHQKTHSRSLTESGTILFTWEGSSAPYTLDDDPSVYYIGAEVAWINTGDTQTFVVFPTSTTRHSTRYYAGNGTLAPIADSGELPELGVFFTTRGTVTPSSVQIVGTSLRIPQSEIPDASGTDYVVQQLAWRAYQIRITYFASGGTPLRNIVRDLIESAGLLPSVSEGLDLGETTYYTTSTFNYLDCVHELIRGAGHLVRASIGTGGEIAVLPQHTIDDTPALVFSTDPLGPGEKEIVSHSLTVHWMAEKATMAYLAENSTESGLPLALESDDELMEGSLVKALQSPLRGISVDETLGSHRLMAVAAGGKVRQLHTNTIEGTIVLAGYRTDLWELTSASYAGGVPIRLIVPQYGFDGTALATAIELGDGVTKVSLDNIRTADRSEMARSMGLTAEAISNTSQKLPATSYIFAKLNTYGVQTDGLTPGTVTMVRWLLADGTEATRQENLNLIKVVSDNAGYAHVCAVKAENVYGWAADPDNPITVVEFTMDGTVYKVPLDNPKFAIAGQRLHLDVRFRE